MAIMIDLNTDELRSSVEIARKTNELISEAAQHLNSVVIHNDWVCPTRETINANTSANRKAALTMQTDAEKFYASIQQATEQFLEAEQQISRMFDAVDAPISQFLSLTPSAVSSETGKMAKNALSTAGDFLESLGEDLREGLGGVARGVDMISFENIADAFRGD